MGTVLILSCGDVEEDITPSEPPVTSSEPNMPPESVMPSEPPVSNCGPTRAIVDTVTDGDTIQLVSGEKIRYILVDTPETFRDDCYADEAETFNKTLVEGREITLEYVEDHCTDVFGRLLAFVSIGDRSVNKLLIERGFACVLFIAPHGEDVKDEFFALEQQAQEANRGLWGACTEIRCNDR